MTARIRLKLAPILATRALDMSPIKFYDNDNMPAQATYTIIHADGMWPVSLSFCTAARAQPKLTMRSRMT
jgi:hypothetical protein